MSKEPDAIYRGHAIYYDEAGCWRYADTGEPIPQCGGHSRPCAYCGRGPHEAYEPDPCLGNLPGVDNACCGHGYPGKAYIRFENGVSIEGFLVRKSTDPNADPSNPEYWVDDRMSKG